MAEGQLNLISEQSIQAAVSRKTTRIYTLTISRRCPLHRNTVRIFQIFLLLEEDNLYCTARLLQTGSMCIFSECSSRSVPITKLPGPSVSRLTNIIHDVKFQRGVVISSELLFLISCLVYALATQGGYHHSQHISLVFRYLFLAFQLPLPSESGPRPP